MLSGSLDLFTITDVLRLVSGNKVAGRLRVTRPERSGSFLLAGGSVVGVEEESGTQSDDDAAIDAALELFDGTGGDFAFEASDDVAGPLALGVDDLIERLDERRIQWDAVREAIGSVDARLSLVSEVEGDVTLTADEWRLLALAASGRSARAVATEAGRPTYEAAGVLSALARRGLVAADDTSFLEADESAEDDADVVEITLSDSPADEDASSQEEREEPSAAVEDEEDAKDEPQEPAASADDEDGDADPIQLLRELGGSPGPRKRPRLLTREEQRMRLRR